eukprot:NODE_3619_length_1318_cov_16.904603_g3165_i0.p1 GENE.NODE_3619_length_1318_cov_16.904603_g3165_i0~~NODE_3619_length_1318_cov_16.904603_g3165_i0.p1  ORF type:complete len:371 (+),score=58.47 NODE_3619_length_1318_cov_16.904603_g3165_i0:41-1114(+)
MLKHDGPYQFIKAGLRPYWKFWGLVGLIRKALIAIIAILVRDEFLQAYLACWVLAITSCVSLYARPYDNNNFNYIEGTVYGLLSVVLLSSLVFTYNDGILAEFNDTVTIAIVVFNSIIMAMLVVFLNDPIKRAAKRRAAMHPKIMAWFPPYLQIKLKNKPLHVTLKSSIEKAVASFDLEMLEWKDQVSEELVEIDEEHAEQFEKLRKDGLRELRKKLENFKPRLMRHRKAVIKETFTFNPNLHSDDDEVRFPWAPIVHSKSGRKKYELDECFDVNEVFPECCIRSTLATNSVSYPADVIENCRPRMKSNQIRPLFTNKKSTDSFAIDEQPPTPSSFYFKDSDHQINLNPESTSFVFL